MGSKKILIVDDKPHVLRVLKDKLTRSGYEVAMAVNGRQALEAVESQRPDLIFLDIMMPELDGYSVCATLKEAPATRDIPVVFLTAKGQDFDRLRALKLGAEDFVSKPFSPRAILALVEEKIGPAQ